MPDRAGGFVKYRIMNYGYQQVQVSKPSPSGRGRAEDRVTYSVNPELSRCSIDIAAFIKIYQ